ncbi:MULTISPECIES: hypothetical protein [Microbacterium]|uniref:hypothetical protein n=1 Tax=Microbacterium TaxID=33882 RepID=UPI000D644ABE|nr:MULTISPECIES: hypothetical protein [Microbacterium]
MVDDIPVRMFYAGRRWRVTDIPTWLRDSIWATPGEPSRGLYGWRFQATDGAGEAVVFDVYRAETDWHVHHCYV